MKTKGMTHIPGTLRAFKDRKRREMRRVMKELREFSRGSAFLPDDSFVVLSKAINDLARVWSSISVTKWGR